MHLCILYNRDQDLLDDDPGREAREDVTRVATALHDALDGHGYKVDLLGVGRDPFAFVETLRVRLPDLVINLCESVAADSRGEMAVPCMLDLLGVPYTGSSALSLGLALHKNKAKEVLRGRGVPTPEFAVISRLEEVTGLELPFPLIIKPSREDASVGIDFESVVHDRAGLQAAVARVLETFKQPAVVERFIEGREIYVPLLGNRPRTALPLTEIAFGPAFEGRPRIVSYRAKWDAESPECIDSTPVRATLPPALHARVVEVGSRAFEALECQDYGRVDLRVSPDGQPYVIDINPNCDLHPEAGFARSAAASGLEYPDLARRLVEIALERTHGNTTHLVQRPGSARRPPRKDRNVFAAGGRLRPRAHRPGHQAD